LLSVQSYYKGWLWTVSVKAKQLEHVILKTDFVDKKTNGENYKQNTSNGSEELLQKE
jgi:hypothetical protein